MIYLIIICCYFFLELVFYIFLKKKSLKFKWLLFDKNIYPNIDQSKLKKFYNTSFNKELGWDRKRNSGGIEIGVNGVKTYFNIDSNGSRKTTNKFTNKPIGIFGDSYAFSRCVNDNESIQFFLEKKLKRKVLNFGVGNFGIDQALIKFEKSILKHKFDDVILIFVPETICRIRSRWKHYLEFGNTFAFKPSFEIKNKRLYLKKNLLNKFDNKSILLKKGKSLSNNDFFYKKKFKKKILKFPFLIRFIYNYDNSLKLFYYIFRSKNKDDRYYQKAFSIIMKHNLKLSHQLYNDHKSKFLMTKILKRFNQKCKKKSIKFSAIVIPQKIDLELRTKKYYINFFKSFYNDSVYDISKFFLKKSKNLYIDDLYGGHLNKFGNKKIAEIISNFIK